MKKSIIVILALIYSFLGTNVLFADTTPDPFTFTDRTDVALNTEYKSNAITVSGIDAPANISIVGGTYSINGAAYTSASGYVSLGNTVKLRKVSASTYSTTKNATLTIGIVSDTFSVTTMANSVDMTPDAFHFTDRTGAALNTEYKSNAITVTGINAAAPISIVGGTYSINGGTYTSASGTVSLGNTVKLRKVSASTYATTKNATLTIGGVSDTFSVTTVGSTLTKTVAFATGSGYGGQPFAGTGAGTDLRMMMLYRAQEMKGSGTITSISFKYFDSLTPAVSCPNTTIKMSHTSQSGLNLTFANNINQGQGSQKTVLDNTTVNIPAATAAGYYTIALATPFNYNGVDNLVVEIAHTPCTGDVHTSTHDAPYNAVNEAIGSTTALTGDLAPILPDTRFNLAGGDSSIRYTDNGTTGALNNYPFATLSKIQLLYTAAEINGSGIITGFSFPVGTSSFPTRGNPTAAGSAVVTIKLGHTSLTGLTTNYANNFNSGTPVTVAHVRTVTIPAGVPDGGYVWVPLPDGAFTYNGTDNLVVEIESSGITGSAAWIKDDSGVDTRLDALAPGATDGALSKAHYFIKFRFAGGPVDVITTENSYEGYPFSNTSSNKRQYLYYATELGTKGSITKVACRIRQDANTSDYNSFTVVIGHTALTALGTTFSDNMIDAHTVFSGTFTVPAGLKAGDWIEIPLSTPFAYDGARNLVVQMSTLQGTALNSTLISLDDTLYLNRRASAPDNTAITASSTSNILGDLRLFMQ